MSFVEQLVGRDGQVETLFGVLEARDRLPSTAVLVGEAGIGKTALWLAGVEMAEACGFTVLSCRPSEAETGFSFAGLTDLLGEVAEAVFLDLPPLQQRALKVALLLEDSKGGTDERLISAAFLSALRSLARDGALLVAVDDLQWLDGPSLGVLRFVLPRLRTVPVAALLSVRGEVPAWLRRSLPEESLVTIELDRLGFDPTRELLRRRVGPAFPRPVLRRLWEASGGNPFFALELASALQRRGGIVELGGELPIPANLDELVSERIGELGSSALEVVGVVAALADPSVPLIEMVVGADAEAGLADALRSKVLELDGERLRFTHPLLASAISSRASPTRQRLLHARLAEVVATTEERARHLALATPRPSRGVALALEEAAQMARARGAPVAAAELAEQALRLTPVTDAEAARRRQLAAADRHFEAGDNDRAIALLDQALAAAEAGTERAVVLVHLAPVYKDVRGPREAIALYREALAGAQGDDVLEATIHLSLADLMRFSEGAEQGLEHAELALRTASRVGDMTLRCRAVAASGLLSFNAGQGIRRAEMEDAIAFERTLPDWPLVDGPTWVLGHQLWWSDELDAARPLLEGFREGLNARSDPEEATALWHLAFLEWRAGNWELAGRYLAESLTLTTEAGRVGMWPAQEAPATAIAAHRGQIDEARAAAERAVAEAAAEGIWIAESGHRWVLGFIELSLGNVHTAVEHLRHSCQIRDTFVFEPGMRLELADTLEALVAVGELDEAEAILVPWERRAHSLDRAWALANLARCRALLLAARGDVNGAFAEFDRALAEHARSIDPFQCARTLLALGATQRRAKQRGAARATLERALETFERLGAPLWVARAQAELARIGGRAPSRGGLTASERRIAGLVADGHSNRQVAAALFIAEHTVETMLSRAYRKLGIHSRAELAHRLTRETEEAPGANG